MSLNKQSGNMYSDITHTWNPLRGECSHKCKYCSTNKLKARYEMLDEMYSGEVRLSEKHLKDNLGKGKIIFVCGQNDLFAENVPDEMIRAILDHCREYQNNTYYFQTKNPSRLKHFKSYFPLFSIYLTTIETDDEELIKMYSANTSAESRSNDISQFFPSIVTIEPIMKFNMEKMVSLIRNSGVTKVYIGLDSGNNNLPEPTIEEVNEISRQLADLGIEVKFKSNLDRLKG